MSLTSVDLPEPLTPVTAMSRPSGIATSMFFRLFARAPLTTSSPLSAGRRRARRRDRAARRAGTAPVSDVAVAAASGAARRALEDHVAAVLAGARARGRRRSRPCGSSLRRARRRARCCRDRAAARASRAAAVVALVQADRRLVEHVEHAGQVRADLRRQPDALPFAARQRRGAAAERQIADADVVEEAEPVADLPQDAAGDQVSRAR